ncbi:hypothetical protein Taro_031274 [Colocasia esculenta]|uniref:Uncharacterized protein n=1 Tax=Colocasia esculenta TaxID=4460 RepID=A0A843W5X2_COLES|nr:hypothetical protein [Colocasia esculenta]
MRRDNGSVAVGFEAAS